MMNCTACTHTVQCYADGRLLSLRSDDIYCSSDDDEDDDDDSDDDGGFGCFQTLISLFAPLYYRDRYIK